MIYILIFMLVANVILGALLFILWVAFWETTNSKKEKYQFIAALVLVVILLHTEYTYIAEKFCGN